MKYNILLILFATSCIYGCFYPPMNSNDIENMVKENFEPLQVKADYDLFDMRIDIIRQTYTEKVNDTTDETKNKPYCELGFDLGNGLFFDLNNNLSLNIDKLLGVSLENDFKINKTVYSLKEQNYVLSFKNDTFSSKYINNIKSKTRTLFRIEKFKDSLLVHPSFRFNYCLINNDTALIKKNRKRIENYIVKSGENECIEKFRKYKNEFKMIDGAVILNDDYRITLSPDKKTITIYRIGKKRDYEEYKIVRNKNQMYIYNPKYYGEKITFDKNKMSLYYHDKVYESYELISK